jgi:hypothetical protein
MATLLVKRKAYDVVMMIPFFAMHYGMFTMVHGIFVLSLFAPGGEEAAGEVMGNMDDGAGFFGMFAVLPHMIIYSGMWIALIALFASHSMSFLTNFLANGEYKKTNTNKLMHAPYKRVIILHLTIIFGAFLVLSTGNSIWGLILLLILKTGVDLIAHIREHQPFKEMDEIEPAQK